MLVDGDSWDRRLVLIGLLAFSSLPACIGPVQRYRVAYGPAGHTVAAVEVYQPLTDTDPALRFVVHTTRGTTNFGSEEATPATWLDSSPWPTFVEIAWSKDGKRVVGLVRPSSGSRQEFRWVVDAGRHRLLEDRMDDLIGAAIRESYPDELGYGQDPLAWSDSDAALDAFTRRIYGRAAKSGLYLPEDAKLTPFTTGPARANGRRATWWQ